MGHPRPKANFKWVWWGVAKPHHNEVPPWLVLLASEVPPCHVGSPAQRPG
ncbi:hypothetical protein HanPI659440_Chr08g0293821 [Helianthus annuus]|nr:hypothetical protein HanPI659440_Chr08g0293821 [Helianthus annuus]